MVCVFKIVSAVSSGGSVEYGGEITSTVGGLVGEIWLYYVCVAPL